MKMPNKGFIVGVGSRMGKIQTGLDLIGMTEIPIVSQAADLASGAMSLATGDYVGAALSVGSLIPGIGQATGAAKMARRVAMVGEAANNIKRGEKGAANLLEITGKRRGIKTPQVKQTASKVDAKPPGNKKAEVDAKPVKKEKVKEKEDVEKPKEPEAHEKTLKEKIDEYYTESPNPLEGKKLEDILKEPLHPGTPKNLQQDGYIKLQGHVEYRKIYNPQDGIGGRGGF